MRFWDFYNRTADRVDHYRNVIRYYRYYMHHRFILGDWSYDLRPTTGVFTGVDNDRRPFRYIATCLFKSSLIGLPIASIAYYRSYDLYHQSVASSRWNAFRLYKRFPAFGLAYSLGVISSSFLFDLPNSPVNHGVAGTIAAYTFRNSLKWSGQVVKSGPGSGIKFFCGALCAGGFMATLKLIAITSPDLKEEPQLYLNPLHWRKGSTPLYNDIDERRLKYAKLNESFIDYQMERNKEFENQYIKDSRDYK